MNQTKGYALTYKRPNAKNIASIDERMPIYWKKERDNELLAQWQEEKPIESLEAAVTDSARFGGINSYGLGYDQGYLDCANQVIKLLSQSTK